MHTRSKLGHWGESVAIRFLRKNGFWIVARNVRTPHGELDIVAVHDGIVVAVEVKTRRTSTYGLPQNAITENKLLHLQQSLEWLIEEWQWKRAYRLDVIAILVNRNTVTITHLPSVADDDTQEQ